MKALEQRVEYILKAHIIELYVNPFVQLFLGGN